MQGINFKRLTLFLTLLFFVASTSAQLLTQQSPEKSGISSERIEKLDDFIQKYIDEKKVPGGVFLVARKGNIVYHKNFGNKNEQGEPYQLNDIFRIASMTKAVTTVAIMQLFEQGMLGLDEPVDKYIPAFKNQVVLDYFNTKFFIDPQEELIFVGMTQIVPFYHGDFWDKMYAIIYGAIND